MSKWKTTDKFLELPLYDINGFTNKKLIFKFSVIMFSIIFMISNSIILLLLFVKDADMNIVEMFNKDFLIYYFSNLQQFIIEMFYYDNKFVWNIDNEFIASVLISLVLAYLFLEWIYSKINYLAKVQRNLSSLKLTQYYLLEHDKKNQQYIFKLKKGEANIFKTFVAKNDDFKQMFLLEKIKIERLGDDKVVVIYSEALPDKDNIPKNIDFKLLTGKDKNFLGIADTEGTAIYSTPKEQGNGLLNGNWLVVGGSGSGKSFALKEMIQNFLLPENYQFVDKIYVINYKASADYNFLRGLDKFKYADDIPSALKLLKAILLDMKAKYKYNSLHSEDNFTAYQTVIIIDEVQTLNETLEAKSLHKIMKNTVQESLSILETLGSKIRASNGSLINVLQKADVNSLPSTAYRSNMRNRFMLKQENVSSAHLVVNSDTTTEAGVNPLRLKQGQFLYWDMLTNRLENGMVVLTGNEANIEEINKLPMDEEAQKVLDSVNELKKKAIEDLELEKKALEQLEEEGKKTFSDEFELELEESTTTEEKQESDFIVEEVAETEKEPCKQSIEHKKEVSVKNADLKEKAENNEDNEVDLFDSL